MACCLCVQKRMQWREWMKKKNHPILSMASFKSFLRRSKKEKYPSSANNSSHGATDVDADSLNEQHIQELKHVFKKFDANGDGKISASELGSIMSCLGETVSDDELVAMIHEVDADGDGFIDLQEFIELNTNGVDSDEILANLRDAFAVYDIDGNGSICAEELCKVMRSLGDNCTLADCKKMISGVDVDGDGSISFEEFKVMMMVGVRFNDLGA